MDAEKIALSERVGGPIYVCDVHIEASQISGYETPLYTADQLLAAYRAGLEDAAKVADAMSPIKAVNGNPKRGGAATQTSAIGDAIRAMGGER